MEEGGGGGRRLTSEGALQVPSLLWMQVGMGKGLGCGCTQGHQQAPTVRCRCLATHLLMRPRVSCPGTPTVNGCPGAI